MLWLAAAAGERPATDSPGEIAKRLEAAYPSLGELYRHLHRHPELSFQETKTAARIAAELRKAGIEVTEGVGKTGVVGLLRNGDGPTIMVRTDLDALPITEATDVPYASQATARDDEGNTVGVMHACGHDVHMTCLVGVARLLAESRDRWKGTLMFVCQPAEERGGGARKMLADGLFERFPKPDYALALHVDATLEAGKVGYTPGFFLANVDSVDIIVRGRGGHGAQPHLAIDPIVIACKLVLDLQTIVSREVKPTDPAVVTVGSIHGGTKHNIIPDEVKLQVTVRSYSDETRQHLLDSIENKALAAAASARAPKPTVSVSEGTPATYNDPELAERGAELFRKLLGPDAVVRRDPEMGAEDFSEYGRAGVPIFMFRLGSVPAARIEAADAGQPLPSLHSSLYHPEPEPTIKTGVKAMSALVLELLRAGVKQGS
jgi:hippurate hydrolase